jgi:hypothetical protein
MPDNSKDSNNSNISCGQIITFHDFVQLPHVQWTLYGISVLIMVVAIVGNQLVTWIIVRTPQLHTTTNWYILNLSVADFLVGLFVIPYRTLEMLGDCDVTSALLTETNCPILRTLTNLCINVGTTSVIIITVERYFAVVHPLAFQLRASNSGKLGLLVIALTWIASFALIIPEALGDYVVDKLIMVGDYGRLSVAYCKTRSELVLSLAYAVVHLVATYLLPLFVVTATSIAIARTFRRLTRESRAYASAAVMMATPTHSNRRREENKRKVSTFIIDKLQF